MKTIFREKKHTYSVDDKDGKDPRVCGTGRQEVPHITQEKGETNGGLGGGEGKVIKWRISFCGGIIIIFYGTVFP
jgi:hypothetical protein